MIKSSEAKKAKKISEIKKYLFLATILIYPITLFIIFYVVVNFNSLLLSFQKMTPDYKFVFNGIENYKKLFQDWFSAKDSLLWVAFRNSFLRFIIITGIGMPLNILFSYYVYRNFFGAKVFRVIVMIPTVFSAMLMALISQKFIYLLPNIFAKMGISNFPNLLENPNYVFMTTTIYSLWVGFSTALIIYPNQMNSISTEIIESAELDGATHLQIIWHIIVPLILPTVTTFMVTGVAGILGDIGPLYTFFDLEASKSSSLIGYVIYQITLKYGKVQYPYVSALGVICTLIAFPLTLGTKWLLEKIDPMEDKHHE